MVAIVMNRTLKLDHPPPERVHPRSTQPLNPYLSQLKRIEARLVQLKQEETAHMLVRIHQLRTRKKEDEDFFRLIENARLEEEV